MHQTLFHTTTNFYNVTIDVYGFIIYYKALSFNCFVPSMQIIFLCEIIHSTLFDELSLYRLKFNYLLNIGITTFELSLTWNKQLNTT